MRQVLEFFFTQVTPVLLLALVGFGVFCTILSFFLGATSLGDWDLLEGIDLALKALAVTAGVFVSFWLAGLSVFFLIELFGGVTYA